MAETYPDMSEGFAGEAVDTFEHHQADKADAAYALVMAAAHGDRDWQAETRLALRVQSQIEGGK